ncbi:hypothetical protein DQ239_09275 [Blastococcus sp. TF02-09]|nr:hypothetical protein DQ239_09275 [Blastococcus sp. TF02-9]
MSRGHGRGPADEVFASDADRVGIRTWARRAGWEAVDGSGRRQRVADELVRSAPARRIGSDHHPRNVIAGSVDGLDVLAFDIAVSATTGWIAEWAVTAAAVPAGAPTVRLTPARLWLHDPDGLARLETGDERFDARWRVLGRDAGARQVADDAAVRQALLATDDGDDFWIAAGHLAALRPDGHRPLLLEHHLRLLAVIQRALGSAAG